MHLLRRTGRAAGMLLCAAVGPGACAPPDGDSRSVGDIVAWRTELSPLGVDPTYFFWAGVPATDGKLAFIDIGSGVAALDVRTGAVAWTAALWDGGAVSENLAYRDGLVFVVEPDRAAALEASTGAVRWRVQIDSLHAATETALDAHALYVGRLDHRVAALDPATGAVRWTADIDPGWAFLSRPTGVSVSGDTVYALNERWLERNGYRRAAMIVALDRYTGAELWRFVRRETPGDGGNPQGAPAVAGRVLVYNDALGGAVTGVDRFTGREVWRVSGDSSGMGPHGTAVIVGDTAFVGSADRWLYAIHPPTGRVLWKTFTRASISSTAVCGNLVLLNEQAVAPVDRETHGLRGYVADDSDENGGFPMSGFAVAGDMAVVVGTQRAYGIRCS